MKKNGFTLVELLAVIVILAIIMIIAIPAVLSTMSTAKSKTFLEFAQKVAQTAEKVYIENSTVKNYPVGYAYIYSIKNDLGLTSVGSFDGFAIVYPHNDDMKKVTVMVWDESYLFQGPASEISVDNLQSRKQFNMVMNVASFNDAHITSLNEIDYPKVRALMIHDIKLIDYVNGEEQGDYSDYPFINGSNGGVIPSNITVTFPDEIEQMYIQELRRRKAAAEK